MTGAKICNKCINLSVVQVSRKTIEIVVLLILRVENAAMAFFPVTYPAYGTVRYFNNKLVECDAQLPFWKGVSSFVIFSLYIARWDGINSFEMQPRARYE